jgi:hypothetical protein
MFARLLLIAGLIALASWGDGFAQEKPADPPKKEEPKKEPKKEEPKKEPKKEEPKKEPKPKEEPKKEPKKEEPKKEEPKKEGTTPQPPTKAAPPKSTLKKYDDVVTKEAKTTPGVFTIHRIDDRVLFEMQADKLGKLFMIRAEVAKGSGGNSFNGSELGHKFIRFERKENKLLVFEAGFEKRGDKAIEAAIEASGTEPIIANFPVEAEGKDRSIVFQATSIFMNDSLSVGANRAGGGGSTDFDKCFLQEVKGFPTNIEGRAQLTFRGGSGGGFGGGPFGGGGGGARFSTVIVHYSLIQLPDTPMQARYFDPRVGYFTEGFTSFSSKNPWVESKEFITRYRLEKKDPSAAVSEVVKPITFYLAPEIPEKIRPWLKKGVEDWAPAFEKAGFKNAIVCKDPPSKGEDPNWDPEDARYSVIRWVAEPIANAMGPHVHDPRSGEVISAHIIFWHDIIKILHMWYFVQCSAQDERARKFPFADELLGELIRYVCAHEVGHTLGLRHNHRASQAYSIEQLRDPKFLEKNGNLASIMSYGRYNYVAQPEDKIPVKDLIPKLAPYDFFAIEWGYSPIKGATTPESEKAALDELAAKQIKEPFLRFGGEDGPSQVDPTVLTENIGSDAIKATELGFKNLDRVLGHLLQSTTEKGEDFELLREAYGAVNDHRMRWSSAVLKQVGGVIESRTLGQRGQQFTRVPKARQQAAVKFLNEQLFTTPTKLLNPEIVNNLRYSGVSSGIMSTQRSLLTSLMGTSRLSRLMDAEVLDPTNAYTVSELVSDVETGLFSELKADAPKVDLFRRNLQRAFVETLKAEFEGANTGGGGGVAFPTRRGSIDFDMPVRTAELRAVARIALKDLQKQIESTLPKVKDATTKAHLQDLVSEIEDTFSKKK